MCGIAGIYHLNGEPVSPVLLRKMTDAISHRGPDGEGFFTDSFIGLGNRRLAIIDLSPSGHLPMMMVGGNYVIAFNGEVYNFRELRAELEAKGHQFRSQTDSEVVLHAYAQWGPKALLRFNGMFALAIWDRVKQELLIARDRFGVKPIYYTLQSNTLLFGSEVKAILAHPRYKVQLDKQALVEYFTFQNYFTDHTLFDNIHILPAGSYLRVPLGSQELNEPSIYWDYDFREPKSSLKDVRELEEELDRLFKQAVNRQLVSDVPVGSYLSGGMDSGSITCVAATQLPNLNTFTCGFDLHSASGIEINFDEREMAELMSYRFGTEHYEMVLKAGDMERVFPKLALHIEEPRVGQSYPNYYAAQLASKFVKVVLSGGGGDELFGGYPWRYYRAVGSKGFDDYVNKYYSYWNRLIPQENASNFFAPIWPEISNIHPQELFRETLLPRMDMDFSRPEDFINHSMYLEAKTFLHGLLLVEDKLSMAHSLETRVPFLDNDLVDFATQLPVSTKLRSLGEVIRINENDPGNKTANYFQKTSDGKMILRKVMERYVPKKVVSAEKQGFSAPDASWFKGESIEYIRKEVLDKRARIYEYLDYNSVNKIVQDHLEGRQNRRLIIWSLLSFEWWLKTFLN